MKFRLFTTKNLIVLFALFFVAAALMHVTAKSVRAPENLPGVQEQKSNDYWKKVLTHEQYHVLHEAGTDIPFTHLDMLNNHEKGTYVTADCGQPVFRSEDKFDSGTGWPSFTKPINPDAVILKGDNSLGMVRTEVIGSKCGGHLGHVFDDGPAPTGKRYCINASALKFIPDKK